MTQEFQFRDIDIVFADFIASRGGEVAEILHRGAKAVSASVGNGNICLDLAEVFESAEIPAVSRLLLASAIVGQPGEYCPLVLDKFNRLYLYRYWKYESDLANALLAMASDMPDIDRELLKDGIARLFSQTSDLPDWQRIAAAAAVRSRFCVISGGPGTGKTTTVVKILALLLEQAKDLRMRIGLAAPTGKAAARLKESIHKAGTHLAELSSVAGKIPNDVSTIQRLLGVIPGSGRFRHNADNPLPFEAVVVDEASMVPLGIMAKLLEALAPGTRLILLGDRDQLASVEAGAVLGDICNTGNSFGFTDKFQKFIAETTGSDIAGDCTGSTGAPLADSIVVLQKNYRFGSNSGIGLVSRCVNNGDAKVALEEMKTGKIPEITISDTPTPDTLRARLGRAIITGYADYLRHDNPDDVLAAFDSFRVLCATRQGLYGVENINSLIESCLADKGFIKPDRQWYHGRPVMVTVNSYTLKLFNGDVGITLNDAESEAGFSVYFPSVNGPARKFSPNRLPAHETVYAMTVHKSQGSEFDKLLMILPTVQNQVLTREILYTGITRARSSVELWCTDEIFLASADKRIQRRSGLKQTLWG